MLLSQPTDGRIDVDVGVVVARLVVRERESAGTEHENVARVEAQFIEQDLPHAPDAARIDQRLAPVDQRRTKRVVDPNAVASTVPLTATGSTA